MKGNRPVAQKEDRPHKTSTDNGGLHSLPWLIKLSALDYSLEASVEENDDEHDQVSQNGPERGAGGAVAR